MSEHLHCGELLGQLSDFLDGEARLAVCQAIETHMLDCPDCRIMVDTLRKTIHLYREQESGTVLPEDVQRRLMLSLDLEDWAQG